MQITMTGRRFEVTPALRQYTSDKFSRLERHFDKINSSEVIFDVEKLRQMVEATINIPGGKIHASAEAEDMYAAIDKLADILDRKVKQHKEKIKNHRE